MFTLRLFASILSSFALFACNAFCQEERFPLETITSKWGALVKNGCELKFNTKMNYRPDKSEMMKNAILSYKKMIGIGLKDSQTSTEFKDIEYTDKYIYLANDTTWSLEKNGQVFTPALGSLRNDDFKLYFDGKSVAKLYKPIELKFHNLSKKVKNSPSPDIDICFGTCLSKYIFGLDAEYTNRLSIQDFEFVTFFNGKKNARYSTQSDGIKSILDIDIDSGVPIAFAQFANDKKVYQYKAGNLLKNIQCPEEWTIELFENDKLFHRRHTSIAYAVVNSSSDVKQFDIPVGTVIVDDTVGSGQKIGIVQTDNHIVDLPKNIASQDHESLMNYRSKNWFSNIITISCLIIVAVAALFYLFFRRRKQN